MTFGVRQSIMKKKGEYFDLTTHPAPRKRGPGEDVKLIKNPKDKETQKTDSGPKQDQARVPRKENT